MLLPIHDRLLISEVQERFSAAFPGLKIEFCTRRRLKRNHIEKYIISPDKKIGDIRNNSNEGNLQIVSGFSAARLEKEFREQFGLHIRLYWKNQLHWEPVSFKEHKSLEQYELKVQEAISRLRDAHEHPDHSGSY